MKESGEDRMKGGGTRRRRDDKRGRSWGRMLSASRAEREARGCWAGGGTVGSESSQSSEQPQISLLGA